MNGQVYSPIYKIILVGESGVGKTCLLSMYVKGIVTPTIPTIAVEFCTKEIQLEDGTIVKAQLWDTAGQERFKSLAMTYYRKANGILLLFDITRLSTFESCVNYIEEIRKNSDENCIIFLIGNKIDLEDERKISTNEAQLFANRQKIKYFETSAVKNQKVEEVFKKLLNEVNEKRKLNEYNNVIVKDTTPIVLKNNLQITRENNKDSICC